MTEIEKNIKMKNKNIKMLLFMLLVILLIITQFTILKYKYNGLEEGVKSISSDNTISNLPITLVLILPSMILLTITLLMYLRTKIHKSIPMLCTIVLLISLDFAIGIGGGYSIRGYLWSNEYATKIEEVSKNHPLYKEGTVEITTEYGGLYYNSKTQNFHKVYEDRIDVLERRLDMESELPIYYAELTDGTVIEIVSEGLVINKSGTFENMEFRMLNGNYIFKQGDNKLLSEKDLLRKWIPKEEMLNITRDGSKIKIEGSIKEGNLLGVDSSKISWDFKVNDSIVLSRMVKEKEIDITYVDGIKKKGRWTVCITAYSELFKKHIPISNIIEWKH